MMRVINEIKSYLISKYDCHTIILYGSYAENNYSKESDIDIACFTDSNIGINNDTSIINGKQLDVWIYNTSDLEEPEKFLHVKTNQIIFDKDKRAIRFIKNINDIYEKGPQLLNDSKQKHLKDWLMKMYVRSQRGDMEAAFRHHWLLTDGLETYFTLRGLWYLGSKKAIQWLKANDIEAYKLFKLGFNDEIGGEHIGSLIDYIINNN